MNVTEVDNCITKLNYMHTLYRKDINIEIGGRYDVMDSLDNNLKFTVCLVFQKVFKKDLFKPASSNAECSGIGILLYLYK